jgi:hypothetical protein
MLNVRDQGDQDEPPLRVAGESKARVPMHSPASRDPRWDRVVEIASKLWIDGVYVVEADPSRTQRYVDLQWAAHQAGRVLGGRVKIETSGARGPDAPTITVTVTYVDPDGNSLQRAEEGLERLLRQVLADHFLDGENVYEA